MLIGISTINDYNNYGNRLQNYALQRALQSRNYDVLTLKNLYGNKKKGKIGLNKALKNILFYGINHMRYCNFLKFNKKFIDELSHINYGYDVDMKIWDKFDFFIIGSDQVWNYTFPRFSEFDFLAKICKPTMSYAASFGVNSIPNNYKELYQNGLNSIDVISVREEKGSKIIRDLTGRNAEIVLDPTFLLSADDWRKLIKDKPKYKEKFVLTYFLDKPDSDVKAYIKYYAKSKKLKIKNLGTRKDIKNWIAGPDDFVNLFSQAQVIFTDSFHACAFSIIFRKQFEVFERNTSMRSMNSRLETLFEMLNLNDRWHKNNIVAVDKKIEYSKIEKILNIQKKSSNVFLDRALKKMEKLIEEYK